MLIQIHMLQNYAPSLLNRDDSGSAKSAVFGGRQRGRISSQCLKRSIRLSDTFQEAFKEAGLLANRTKRLPTLIGDALQKMDVPETDRQAIVKIVPQIGQESTKREGKTGEDSLETRQLIFVSDGEVQTIAQKLLDMYQAGPKKWEKLKIEDITKALGQSVPRSVDVAMFGRMTTSAAFEDVQAAVQVAHALSVNELTRIYDFYTAVDDLKKEDDTADAGAGMIGDVELNSSTYYKYFNIHWEGLVENLGGDKAIAAQAVIAFVEATALAQPTGKQNSTAALNPPDFIMVEISDKNHPINYANAFLQPAAPYGNDTLVSNAIRKLNDYTERIGKVYGRPTRRATCTTEPQNEFNHAEPIASLADLQQWVANHLEETAHA